MTVPGIRSDVQRGTDGRWRAWRVFFVPHLAGARPCCCRSRSLAMQRLIWC